MSDQSFEFPQKRTPKLDDSLIDIDSPHEERD